DQVVQIFADDLLDLIARDRADGMFRAIMNYANHVSETEPRALDSFFSGLGPEAKEAHMATTVEQSRAQGRAEGAAQGRAEGRAQGRAEGAAQVLTRLLAARFGPLSAEQDARIQAASAEEIDTWIDRFTSAETIEDILR